MDLPTATQAKPDFKPDMVNIDVDKLGNAYVEKKEINLVDLQSYLSNKFRINTNVPVYISGDKDATHGMIIGILDLVRRAGIQKVSFAISPAKTKQQQ
jgi:biopolymer transport protein ExbD